MKKPSTPQESDILEKKLEIFACSPANDETALRRSLLGKNTAQAVRIIAMDAQRRFGGKGRNAEHIIKTLLPHGRAVSWRDLDINICNLCQGISDEIDCIRATKSTHILDMNGHLCVLCLQVEFFDNIRHVLCSLPKRLDYKELSNDGVFFSVEDVVGSAGTCFLCGRTVFRLKKGRKTLLCHEHDIPSHFNEYRRRKTLRSTVIDILDTLEVSIPTPYQLRNIMKLDPCEYYIKQCLATDGHFKMVAAYLRNNSLLPSSAEDVVRAMEAPVLFSKISDLEKDAWFFYFKDCAKHFELYAERLVLMEAWLQAEDERNNGIHRLKRNEKHVEVKRDYNFPATRWCSRWIM